MTAVTRRAITDLTARLVLGTLLWGALILIGIRLTMVSRPADPAGSVVAVTAGAGGHGTIPQVGASGGQRSDGGR